MNISPLVHAIFHWCCFWIWKLFTSFWVAIIPFLNTCWAGVLSPRPNSSLRTSPQNQNCSSWCQSLNGRRLNLPSPQPLRSPSHAFLVPPGTVSHIPQYPHRHNPVSTVSPKGSNPQQQCNKSYRQWTELLVLFSHSLAPVRLSEIFGSLLAIVLYHSRPYVNCLHP